jgi:hypothetical protein
VVDDIEELDDEQGPEWDSNFDAERARSLISKLRGEVKAAKALGLTDEQQQMLSEYDLLREASQTDAERQQAQIEALQEAAGQVPTLTAENLRLQVALDRGLSPVLAKRLQGGTREELEADANTLLGLVGTGAQTQGMRPNPAQGTSGGGTGPTLDDQIAQARKDGNTKLAIRLESQKLLSQ